MQGYLSMLNIAILALRILAAAESDECGTHDIARPINAAVEAQRAELAKDDDGADFSLDGIVIEDVR